MKDDLGILVTLEDGQSGYDIVGDYIGRYWRHNGDFVDTVVVYLEISYDGREYYPIYDVASPQNFDDILFDYDWWEGEKYIRLKGIKYLHELNIEGGVYTE